MKQNGIFLWILGSLVFLSVTYELDQAKNKNLIVEVERLTQQNERLRSFDARLERRKHWIDRPENIDLDSVSKAEHLLGTPAPVVAALIFCENGPEDIETGSIDKTDFWAQNLPIKYWSTLDGARTLNRMAWAWFRENPKSYKDFLIYAARPYTAMNKPLQLAWASNMIAASTRFEASIAKDSSVPVLVPNFTPTPDYGYNSPSKGKAIAPAKKAHSIRRKRT